MYQKKPAEGGNKRRLPSSLVHFLKFPFMLLEFLFIRRSNNGWVFLDWEICAVDRDNDLHRLLFMPNGLPDGAKLAYYVKGQVNFDISFMLILVSGVDVCHFQSLIDLMIWYLQRLLGGYKQGNGIFCNCCDREVNTELQRWHQIWVLHFIIAPPSLYSLT